jgi:hypothetical protein
MAAVLKPVVYHLHDQASDQANVWRRWWGRAPIVVLERQHKADGVRVLEVVGGDALRANDTICVAISNEELSVHLVLVHAWK